MNAVILSKIGPISNLKFTIVNTPQLKNEEALIKVNYCGLNHLDLLVREGIRKGPKQYPHILGSEIVGKVIEIRTSEKLFEKGEIVAVYPWEFCGKCSWCRNGFENLCKSTGTVGRTRWGGYAQFAAIPVRNLIKLPQGLKEDAACASLLSAPTALHLIKRANIPDKSTVLITGATGGVGTALIQLLKHKKSRVICITSQTEKIARLKKLGVDQIYLTEDYFKKIKNTYLQGIGFIVDLMGGWMWSENVEVLAKKGTLVFCATTLPEEGKVNIASAFTREVNILGSSGATKQDVKDVLQFVLDGVLQPVIDSVFPLKDAAAAQKKLAAQKIFGKILLKINSDS